MDFLDIVMELRKRYRIQIPEEDYPQLASMDSTCNYLEPLDEGRGVGQVGRGLSATAGQHAPRRRRAGERTERTTAHQCHMAMYDTIIIGAGMSGLAAGIRLAYFDQRVCILERHYTIGGLNSFYRLRGRDYDVGLHAVTNFTPPGTKKGPLGADAAAAAVPLGRLRAGAADRLVRRLSRGRAAVRQRPGTAGSGNRAGLSGSSATAFSSCVGADRRLRRPGRGGPPPFGAARSSARSSRDPLLVEMLFCPLMWYGNAREHDMDFGQFCIMFRSIFMEGLARPLAGVRLILKNLVRRYRELGGELKLRSGVDRIHVEDGRATGVVLDDGTNLQAAAILSSAGWVETMRLCDDVRQATQPRPGQMSFIESISILDAKPQQLGHDRTIVFYNDSRDVPLDASPTDLCDVRTGVICSPNNYLYGDSDRGRQIAAGRRDPHHVDRQFRSAGTALSDERVPPGKTAVVRSFRGLRRAFHARFSRSRDRHRLVHAQHDSAVHLA